jgi:hypothetical protein
MRTIHLSGTRASGFGPYRSSAFVSPTGFFAIAPLSVVCKTEFEVKDRLVLSDRFALHSPRGASEVDDYPVSSQVNGTSALSNRTGRLRKPEIVM